MSAESARKGAAAYEIREGDCAEVMAAMPEHSVDAVVCDPPYGLGFMGKNWDAPGGTGDFPMRRTNATNTVNTGASRQGGRQRASEDWHKRQLRDARSYQAWCEAWGCEALRVLRPGGYLLAMGGTRTYHRLAAGLEDAGFEVRDMVEWLYGSGFPKHESCLKPAHEPAMLGRKAAPRSEPLQIDACRIEGEERPVMTRTDTTVAANAMAGESTGATSSGELTTLGRWPANVVLDEDAAAMLDEQSGELVSGANPTRRGSDKFRLAYGDFAGQRECVPARGVDVGGASRFVYCAKADGAERNAGLGDRTDLFSDPDAPERNDHPTVKPIALMRWLCRLVTPPGGTVLDPFTGSGTTGCAAALEGFRFIGIEQDADYARIARARLAHWALELAA